jgi:hypothetical protein
VNGALGVLAFLIGVSGGLFVLISLLVLVPGRSEPEPDTAADAVWLGGPSGGEHGVSAFGLVLRGGRQAQWAGAPAPDWTRLAETSEPNRHIGGASAGW